MKFKKSNYASEDAGLSKVIFSDNQINKIVDIVYDRVMKKIDTDNKNNIKATEKSASTKKKIDLEVYGTICICKTFNDPNDFEYFEPFKHALYDNMCHFHKDASSYEDFDEIGYIINKYTKYEIIKNPEAHICDILEPLFIDIIDNCSQAYIMGSFTPGPMSIEYKRQILNGIAFGYACDKLVKDESRIADYDFSDIFSDEQYLSDVEFIRKWTLKSTHDEYVKKYIPKSLNNIGDDDADNTVENINYSTKISKGDK